jgi:uncharacterized Zn finger protein
MSLQQSSPETKMTATCPECGSSMRISAVTPIMLGNRYEDIAYWCKECGNMRTRTVDTRWADLRSV